MSRRLSAAVIGLFALTIFVGTAFVSVSSAAPSHANRRSGLTRQGVENARQAGMPSRLVTMAPQSSLKLLSRATKISPHAARSEIGLIVGLKLRHVAKLKSFLRQVQNPASTVYHQWLTPKEFTERYGPSKAQVTRVVQFLKAHGITVESISSNRTLIHTKATTQVYEHAFGVMINDYKLDGRSFYSTTDSPKLPRVVAPLVANILGLDHGRRVHSHLFERPLTSSHGMEPRLSKPAPSLTNLSPLQIAHAYNYPDITDASNGRGVNVAILTAVSSGLADLTAPHDFWAIFGLPDHTINVIPVGGDNGKTSGMPETLLDVEYAGAMGPGI